MLAIIKQFVRRMLMGKGKGILQIPPQKAVDDFAADILKKFKQNGIPDEAITNSRDVKIIWEQITNREAQILHTNLTDVLKKPDPFKKAGDVVDLTGKKIDTSKPILGGKNVPETEEQILERLNRQNKESVERLRNKEGPIDWDEVDKIDPEDFAHGGRSGSGLNYLLGEDDQNSRVPLSGGKFVFDAARRKFLQAMGIGAAGITAAKTGLFGLLKGGKKAVIKDLTSVPIKAGVDGMPAWFKPLVNKVIAQGDDVTKKFATQEREIVHQVSLEGKIGKDALGVDDVRVTQDLNTGDVRVQYNTSNSTGEYGVDLNYKAGEVIEPTISKTGKVTKGTTTKPEFSAVEAEPEIVNWDGDIEWSGENAVSKVDDLLTDTTKLETYATGKNPTIKKLLESEKKTKYVNKLNNDQMEQINFIESKHGPGPDPSDFVKESSETIIKKASGGRVPLSGGLLAKGMGKFTKSEILIKMLEKTLKGSKDSWSKTNLPNFIKELKAKPELANDPKVWNFFTNKLPKNQRLVVHSDDTVDFWTQSDFGPHNIKTTDKFHKKHPYLTRDQAVNIQNMEPEDQILEMKRLETIRNRTTNATGGLAGLLGE